MKWIIVPILSVTLFFTAVSAQQSGPLPGEVVSIAEQVTDLVLDALPRQVRDPLMVGVAGFLTGERVTQLGELFTRTVTNHLANKEDRRITVLAPQHPEGVTPDYVVHGTIYLADDDIYVVVQLIRTADMAVEGGFERSFPATDSLQALLTVTGASGQGGDQYEPDGRERPQALPIGELVSGHTFMPEGDEDWFLLQFEGLEGVAVVEVHTTGPTDTYITVYGPDDPWSMVVENDDYDDHNARVNFTAAGGQHYWLMVRGYDETITGPYGIMATLEQYGEDPFEPDNRMDDATPLELDREWVSTMLMPSGDEDWFSLDIPRSGQGMTVLGVETEGGLDTWIDLFDSSGDQLAEDDDGSGNANALLRYTIEESGRYYVKVRHFDDSGTGPYDIRAWLERAEPDEFEPDNVLEDATSLSLDGAAQSHTFAPAEDTDWFTFTLPSGMTVTIETSGDIDTVMRVLDIEGNMVAEDDDSGEDGNARIRRFLPQGTYYLEISQFPDTGQSGAEYSVRISSG